MKDERSTDVATPCPVGKKISHELNMDYAAREFNRWERIDQKRQKRSAVSAPLGAAYL
jgi:hypothetical protein